MFDVLIPEVVTNFRMYDGESDRLVGTVDCELPSIELMTETLTGSGIAGEIETTVMGHLKAMAMKIALRNLTHKSFSLLNPYGVSLSIRGAMQVQNPTTGLKANIPLNIRVKGVAKKLEPGKLATAKAMDTSVELSIHYLKITLNGIEKVEIDQFNYIYKVEGTDYLLDIKANLGEV